MAQHAQSTQKRQETQQNYAQPQGEQSEREPDEPLVACDRTYGDKVEELRVSIGTFKGNKFVSFRVWWQSAQDNVWRPDAKKGLGIKIKELDAVIEALQTARERLAK